MQRAGHGRVGVARRAARRYGWRPCRSAPRSRCVALLMPSRQPGPDDAADERGLARAGTAGDGGERPPARRRRSRRPVRWSSLPREARPCRRCGPPASCARGEARGQRVGQAHLQPQVAFVIEEAAVDDERPVVAGSSDDRARGGGSARRLGQPRPRPRDRLGDARAARSARRRPLRVEARRPAAAGVQRREHDQRERAPVARRERRRPAARLDAPGTAPPRRRRRRPAEIARPGRRPAHARRARLTASLRASVVGELLLPRRDLVEGRAPAADRVGRPAEPAHEDVERSAEARLVRRRVLDAQHPHQRQRVEPLLQRVVRVDVRRDRGRVPGRAADRSSSRRSTSGPRARR